MASDAVAADARGYRSGDRSAAAALIVVPAAIVLAIGLLGSSPDLTGDVLLYHDLSGRLLSGGMPYVDFDLEYPPLALLPMVVPRLFAPVPDLDAATYQTLFVITNAVQAAAIALVIWRTVARHRALPSPEAALAAYALLVALTAHLVAWRYDVFPALLVALAAAALVAGLPGWAGAWLGLGAAAKLYPLVIVPVAVAWYVARGHGRDALRLSAAAAIGLAAWFLPILVTDASAVLSFLSFHAARGLQLESAAAGLLALGSLLGWTPVGVEFASKSYQLTTPLAPTVLTVQSLVAVASQLALAVALVMHLRLRKDGHGGSGCVLAYGAAAVVLFMLTNRVLSPQYLVWLLPLVPMIRSGVTVGLVALAALTGLALFPALYPRLIGLDGGAVLLLNLRNAWLAATLVALFAMHPPWRARWAPWPTARVA